MSRVKRGQAKHARHKRILKLAKGYRASYSKLYRVAKQQTVRSQAYAFAHRRKKERRFQKIVDHQDQCRGSYSRHFLQPLHERPEKRRNHRKPQSFGGIGGQRSPSFGTYAEIAKANANAK